MPCSLTIVLMWMSCKPRTDGHQPWRPGDGDLAAIGCAETVHAAVRGEKFTTVFINNAIYGMTDGQMALTTLAGQITGTSPYGKKAEEAGMPLRVSEMLATIDGARYVARVAVNTPGNLMKAKAAITEAFKVQLRGEGYSIVEVLATCPTNWGMTPVEANEWIGKAMMPYFPLGVFKNVEAPRNEKA